MVSHLRAAVGRLFGPFARWLLRRGVSPDAVTLLGAVGAVAAALLLLPSGHLVAGAIVIGVFAFLDALDGTMAREAGRSGPWGAFLDATLDRLVDGAIFSGLTLWFVLHAESRLVVVGAAGSLACLVLGNAVSYARAKAESVGYFANVGIAERGERLIVSLVAAGLVGLGLPTLVLVVALWVLAAASLVTVVQRIVVVRAQALGREVRGAPGAAGGPAAVEPTTEDD